MKVDPRSEGTAHEKGTEVKLNARPLIEQKEELESLNRVNKELVLSPLCTPNSL